MNIPLMVKDLFPGLQPSSTLPWVPWDILRSYEAKGDCWKQLENNDGTCWIPSGKRLHNYGKTPCLMGKSTISMVIFNSKLLVITMLDHAGTLRFNQQRRIIIHNGLRIATLLGEWLNSGDEMLVSCWMGWWDCKEPTNTRVAGSPPKKDMLRNTVSNDVCFQEGKPQYIPGKLYGYFFFVHYWVLPVTDVFLVQLRILVIVKGCSNPLTTPGSDILRQSPKEEFQPDVEQIRSRDRVPKSGHKYCHISHQIWIYP